LDETMPPDAHPPFPAPGADTPPKPPPEIDRAALLALLEGQARQVLDRLLSAGTAQTEAVIAEAGGWTLLVSLFPTPAPASEGKHQLTRCDRDCLRLLSVADRPLTAEGVRDALEDDCSPWGLITVKRALAKLKKLGVVFSTRKPPRGYFLAERHTLFTSRPGAVG
jgi:hypothetical protein